RCAVAKSVSAGLVLVAIGLALMLMIGVDSSWTALLPGLLVTSLGTGLFNPTGSALALNALPDEQSGLAAGANDTFRQTGVAVGIAALGTLVPAGAALGGNPQAYVDGLHHALIASSFIALAGSVATAWLLIPTRGGAPGAGPPPAPPVRSSPCGRPASARDPCEGCRSADPRPGSGPGVLRS